MLYVPQDIAHGFQTLEDDTVVYYQMSELYHPRCARGVRWNDSAFGIDWPEVDERIISDKDKNYLITLNYESSEIKNTYWMITIILDKKIGIKKEQLMELMSEKISIAEHSFIL